MSATRLLACCSAVCLILSGQSKPKIELSSGYRTWLENDVAYIITDVERQAFNRLQNDEEREQFVEQFWLRRDPTPDTLENEFKEEHYRRIAYANERFPSGVPGWKTDRGRTYIKFGPPDELEAHPSGGTYQRPPEQGGGRTTTYPFEKWRYRFIDGIGTDVIIEFVDPSTTGEYRMAYDPVEKEALQHVPGYVPPVSTPTQQFERLNQFAALQRAPSIKFTDLEALVTSTVKYNSLPMTVRADFLRLTDATVLTPVTIQFESRDLQFKMENGLEHATVNLYMRVSSMARRAVAVHEDVVSVQFPEGNRQEFSVYQHAFFLPPGMYRLNVVARDVTGGGTNNFELALRIPQFEPGTLAASSIILADLIEKVPARNAGSGAFVIGNSKVRPRISGSFRRDEKMGIYFQVYEMTAGVVKYQVTHNGSKAPVIELSEEIAGSQTTVEKLLPLSSLEPGDYILKLTITDRSRNKVLTPSVPFSVR